MKKRLIVVLIVLIMTLCLCSCGGKTQHEQIVEAAAKYYHTKKSNVTFDCYGEFNGACAGMVNLDSGQYAHVVIGIEVDGILFGFPDSHVLRVFYNGEFYELRDAFDLGLLSHDDLLTLYKNYYGEEYSE